MADLLPQTCIKQLFLDARTHHVWQKKEVARSTLEALHDVVKMGPTSANCQPIRLVFVTSPAGKEKLQPFLDAGNVKQTMAAPVTAIIAYDLAFYEKLPTYYPHTDAKSWFVGNEPLIYNTAFRNSSLQGGYLILAARALGLDCGPMSGFDNKGVDAAFFAGTSIRSNFLCNLGYGDATALHPRSPRPSFTEICTIV